MSYEHPWEAIADELAEQEQMQQERTLLEIADSCDEYVAIAEPSSLVRRRCVMCLCAKGSYPGLVSIRECLECYKCR